MKIGGEYSAEKVMAQDFERLAEEAGLGRPLVRRRVPELAEIVIASLAKVQIANPAAEKVAGLIRQRCEKTKGLSCWKSRRTFHAIVVPDHDFQGSEEPS